MPRGGARPGAGRKPKPAHLRAIDGGAGKRPLLSGVPTTNASTAIAEIEEFEAPDSLPADARAVWLLLAPHAFKARTLVKRTAYQFELLCRNIVLERRYADSPTDAGSANHRGIIQRVDAELLRFDLSPCGKPVYEAEDQPKAPANPVDRFLKRG